MLGTHAHSSFTFTRTVRMYVPHAVCCRRIQATDVTLTSDASISPSPSGSNRPKTFRNGGRCFASHAWRLCGRHRTGNHVEIVNADLLPVSVSPSGERPSYNKAHTLNRLLRSASLFQHEQFSVEHSSCGEVSMNATVYGTSRIVSELPGFKAVNLFWRLVVGAPIRRTPRVTLPAAVDAPSFRPASLEGFS